MKKWPGVKGTLILSFSNEVERKAAIQQAASILYRGGLVAFPTETVYGLGADALNEKAVQRIFFAKGRPIDNPLIIHLADCSQVPILAAHIPTEARKLMEEFWPGPLTIILKRLPMVSDVVTGGLDTVALRVPDHPLALELLRTIKHPVVAPSANLSGRPSPTTAIHVINDLAGRIDAVLDGGSCSIGVESTVLDMTSKIPKVLRPGGLTVEALTEFLKIKPKYNPEVNNVKSPLSPGMKYRHYSPRAPLYLIQGDKDKVRSYIIRMAEYYKYWGLKVGVLTSIEEGNCYSEFTVMSIGKCDVPTSQSTYLFYALRYMDDIEVDLILAEGCSETGLGLAVMNRLRKAAGDKIISIE